MSKSEVTAVRFPAHIYEFINAQTEKTSANRNSVILDLITSSPAYNAYLSGGEIPAPPVSNDEKLDTILRQLENLTASSNQSDDLSPIYTALDMLEAVLAASKDGVKGYQINSFAQGAKALLEATSYLRGSLDARAVQNS
jgi:hypothetical protein